MVPMSTTSSHRAAPASTRDGGGGAASLPQWVLAGSERAAALQLPAWAAVYGAVKAKIASDARAKAQLVAIAAGQQGAEGGARALARCAEDRANAQSRGANCRTTGGKHVQILGFWSASRARICISNRCEAAPTPKGLRMPRRRIRWP